MGPKSTTHHYVNAFGEFEPSNLSRGQLIQQVADLATTAGWIVGPGRPRAKTGRHSSQHRRVSARGRSGNANQQLATHTDNDP